MRRGRRSRLTRADSNTTQNRNSRNLEDLNRFDMIWWWTADDACPSYPVSSPVSRRHITNLTLDTPRDLEDWSSCHDRRGPFCGERSWCFWILLVVQGHAWPCLSHCLSSGPVRVQHARPLQVRLLPSNCASPERGRRRKLVPKIDWFDTLDRIFQHIPTPIYIVLLGWRLSTSSSRRVAGALSECWSDLRASGVGCSTSSSPTRYGMSQQKSRPAKPQMFGPPSVFFSNP